MNAKTIFLNEQPDKGPHGGDRKLEDFLAGAEDTFMSFPVGDKWLPIKISLYAEFKDFYDKRAKEIEEYIKGFWRQE